jgi:hypothetical protein
MGKTSAALHILHYPDVVTRYRDRRYFVGCDAVTSAEALAALILQIMRVPLSAGGNRPAPNTRLSPANIITSRQL